MAKQTGKSKKSIDKKIMAKPVGYRLYGNHYEKPTQKQIDKGEAYYENRANRSDANPNPNAGHRKNSKSLKQGGLIAGLGIKGL